MKPSGPPNIRRLERARIVLGIFKGLGLFLVILSWGVVAWILGYVAATGRWNDLYVWLGLVFFTLIAFLATITIRDGLRDFADSVKQGEEWSKEERRG